MPAIQCLAGQFFDDVRGQCINCSDACSSSRNRDEYCAVHCPFTETPIAKDVSTFLNTNTVVAIIVAILSVAVIALILIVCMKRRRSKDAMKNVDEFELQPDDDLSPESPGVPECNTEERIRLGGLPEENADHTATQLVPNCAQVR